MIWAFLAHCIAQCTQSTFVSSRFGHIATDNSSTSLSFSIKSTLVVWIRHLATNNSSCSNSSSSSTSSTLYFSPQSTFVLSGLDTSLLTTSPSPPLLPPPPPHSRYPQCLGEEDSGGDREQERWLVDDFRRGGDRGSSRRQSGQRGRQGDSRFSRHPQLRRRTLSGYSQIHRRQGARQSPVGGKSSGGLWPLDLSKCFHFQLKTVQIELQ